MGVGAGMGAFLQMILKQEPGLVLFLQKHLQRLSMEILMLRQKELGERAEREKIPLNA